MIQYKVITFLMFLAAMLCGCQKSQVSQRLDLAEAIMEERPDSALAILREIDGSALRGEPQARHALLLSQALDRNRVFVPPRTETRNGYTRPSILGFRRNP